MRTKQEILDSNIVRMQANITYLNEMGEQFGNDGSTEEVSTEDSLSNEEVNDNFTSEATENSTKVEVDVTDFVETAEANAAKIDSILNNMDAKFNDLVNMFGKMTNDMDSKIQSVNDKLSHEIKKTHPTPKHKLELRSLDAAPFTINPHEYWEDKLDNYDVVNGNKIVDGTELNSYQTNGRDKAGTCGTNDYTLTDVQVNNSYDESNVMASFYTWRPY